MKLAIKYLRQESNAKKDDLLTFKRMLKDPQNSPEMDMYFNDQIKESKDSIISFTKAIKHLKTL